MKKEISDQSLTRKAVAAMKDAVHGVVEDHCRRQRPLATWKNGRVVYKDAASGKIVREDSVSYSPKSGE